MKNTKTSSIANLYKILDKVRNLDSDDFVPQQKLTSKEAWGEILRFDPISDKSIEKKYLELLDIFQYVESDLDALSSAGIDIEKYSIIVDDVLSTLLTFPLNNSSWTPIRGKIASINIDRLESCGDMMALIGREFGDPSIEEIDKIVLLIEDIRIQISNSDMEDNIKKILIDKIDRLRKSLEKGKVFGAFELKRVTEQVLIETTVLSNEINIDNMTEKGRNDFKSFIDVLSKCNSLYALAEKVYPQLEHLVSYASHHLLPGK